MSSPFGFKSGFGEGKEMRAPIIKKDEIVFGELIATGAFGEVYRGTCRGKSVAMKRLPAPEDEEEVEQILNEMEIVINVRHPNIVLFMGVCIEEDTGDIIIVQELMDCDLFSYLRKNKITLVEKLHIILQISEGMAWLHGGDPMILHSDLKPENILMDNAGNAKICDFGLSSVVSRRHSSIERDGIIGTPLYMGPEALLEESIGKAADVYSFAVVAWAIINVQEPFSHIHDYEALVDSVVYNNERPPITDIEKISPKLANLMNRMWAPEAKDRPSFPEILAELQNLIANVALPGYEPAQEFWSSQFGGKLEVPFNEFKTKAAEFLGMDPIFYKVAFLCFSEIASCRNNEPVKILNFNKALHWFGGFAEDENGSNLFDRVLDTFKCPWFYGPITSKQANAKLGVKHFKRGTFLVRLNTAENSKEEPFRISTVGKQGIIHYRIKNKKTLFEVSIRKTKVQSPPTINDCIEVCKKVLKLKLPCPGREYNEFFDSDAVMYAYAADMGDSSDSF